MKVQAGDGFSVFLTEKGQVYTCGEGNYGRLGHANTSSVIKPMIVEYFRTNRINIVDIKTGGRHTYAVSDRRELYVWGFGYYYQLGNRSIDDFLEPAKIPLTKEVVHMSCGYFHSAFILGEDIKPIEEE